MIEAHDIPDSTDWLQTPLFSLAPLENALHCQICKEFFDTPMLTSCCHTFCSKCIRTALSTDGCCPACRTQDQASKLRNNWQVQELVSTFLAARPITLKVARDHQDLIRDGALRPGKRKREVPVSDQHDQGSAGRSTRSKSRRLQTPEVSQVSISDTASDLDYREGDAVDEPATDDGLVECPLGCGQRMKVEQVEPHLDRCEDERKAREAAAARARARAADSKLKERLTELNYSMMKEKDLVRKMKDLGIPTSGSKQLMMRRHTAWVNIWNANCDSSKPREKRDLLRELDMWERTYGGYASNHSDQGVMKKEFDGKGWMNKNSDDFSKLIENARRSRKAIADNIEQTKSTLSVRGGSGDVLPPQPHGAAEDAAERRVMQSPDEASTTTHMQHAEVPVLVASGTANHGADPALVHPNSYNHQTSSQPIANALKNPKDGGLGEQPALPTIAKVPMFAAQQ